MNKAPTPSTASGASFGQQALPLESNFIGEDAAVPCSANDPLDEFRGPSNSRQARVLDALLVARRMTQNEVRNIGGALNGPHIISELRQQGLCKVRDLQTEWIKCIDRDGKKVRYGVYILTDRGAAKVREWQARTNSADGVAA